MAKILVVDRMHESLIPLLEELNHKVDYVPTIDRKGILEKIESYHGLIIRSKTKVDSELIFKGSNLKFIGRAGAGIDNLDVDMLVKHGIAVLNAPEGNRDSLGEHSVGMILAILHNLRKSDLEIRDKIWDREGNRGFELKGKTIGIFGFGHMGSSFAEKLLGFGCEVLAYDRYKMDFGNPHVKEVSLEELQERTQILSINIPLTDETRNLFNYQFLDQFKKLFILINTARGEVLSLKDLLSMIKEKKLAGAALDVLENEKLASLTVEEERILNELMSIPNVHFSPHVAGWTYESYERINQVLVNKISKLKL